MPPRIPRLPDGVDHLITAAQRRGYCLARAPDGRIVATRLGVPVVLSHMLEALQERARMPSAAEAAKAALSIEQSAVVVDIRTRSRLAAVPGGRA